MALYLDFALVRDIFPSEVPSEGARCPGCRVVMACEEEWLSYYAKTRREMRES